MLNSFCKQNNHLGVEFAKVPTVCKVKDTLANTPSLWIWQSSVTKMHVDKYVLGKGFGCTGTLTDDIYIWTAMLILNFLKILQNDCCTLRATMVEQPFWGYFISPL